MLSNSPFITSFPIDEKILNFKLLLWVDLIVEKSGDWFGNISNSTLSEIEISVEPQLINPLISYFDTNSHIS